MFGEDIGNPNPKIRTLQLPYELEAKLPFTSFSLGGSCCAKIPKIDRGCAKTRGLFHLSKGYEKIPKTWQSIGGAPINSKPRENKQVILTPSNMT